MGYDFIIEYKQGKYNQVADGLSRNREEVVIYFLTLPNLNWWDSMVQLHDINMEVKNLKEKNRERRVGRAMVR